MPSFDFVLWLLCHRRLNTRDRLKEWGTNTDERCMLCESCNESMDPLFFLCSVSKEVWGFCQDRCFIHRGEYEWKHELEWMKIHYIKDDFQGQVRRLSLLTAVYHLWSMVPRIGRVRDVSLES